MKKSKMILTGLMAATMLMVSACGSSDATAETTTAVETTVEETTTEKETTAEETTTVEETVSKDLQVMREFAEEVQDAVEAKDIEWLADLSEYPVYVGIGEDGQEVEDRDAFVALGAENIFTDELAAVIAEINFEELEEVEAGVVMGESVNITIAMIDGAPAITGINL